MNKCIKLSYWPQSFKIAKVIPILKSSKAPSEAQSYRPISLLNSMGKILERVIYSRIIEFVEEKNLLPSVQFGFRRGHSTTHQAMRIKKFIMKNKRLKKSVGLLLLDIEKAFDSVWHDGLIHKLIQMKFPAYLIKMIDAFIRNRKFIVTLMTPSQTTLTFRLVSPKAPAFLQYYMHYILLICQFQPTLK